MPATKPKLTTDKQILYLVQWFAEFSDFQRGDFLADYLLPLFGPFLSEKILVQEDSGMNGDGGDEEEVTNGLGALGLDDQTQPPSIFQCRMKLFTDWYTTWTETDRLEFLLRLRNIDSVFLSEFYRLFLHRHGINDSNELASRLKQGEEVLLERLDINEKVFESKLPEVLARCPVGGTPNGGQTTSATPDLLTDVVGIKCESGSNSIEDPESLDVEEAEEIAEVIMEEAEETGVEVQKNIPEVTIKEEVNAAAAKELENIAEEPEILDDIANTVEEDDAILVDLAEEVIPLVTVTISPPDVVA